VSVPLKIRKPFFELDPHPTREEIEYLKQPAQNVDSSSLDMRDLREIDKYD